MDGKTLSFMAHLWMHDGRAWTRSALAGPHVAILLDPKQPLENVPTPRVEAGAATISGYSLAEPESHWVLYAAPAAEVEVNGRPLRLGMRVLQDRDAISLGGRPPIFFSTEELARVGPFPVMATPVFCARCKQRIQAGTPAVRCPSCGHWCEESSTKPCWSYAPNCPLCDQPTSFDTGYRWTPEGL